MSGNRRVFIGSSFYGINYVNATPERYFSNPALYLEAQKRFQERFPVDIISCPVSLAGEFAQYGAEIRYQKTTAPIIKQTPYERGFNSSRWRNLDMNSEYYAYMCRSTSKLRGYFSDKPILANVISPVDYGLMIYGMDQWIQMLLFDKNQFYEELAGFIRIHDRFKRALKQAGADLMVMTNVMMNNRIISDRIIHGEILPFLKEHMDQTIPLLIHSTFMPIEESIKNLNELESTSGYVINGRDLLSSINNKVNSESLIAGNFGSENLYRKSPETIEKRTYSLMSEMSDREKFIVSTAGADLNLETTEEQVHAIFKGVKRYENEFGIE